MTRRDPLGQRRALWVMTAAHGIQHFYVAGLAVTYPFVVAQFKISYAVLGLVLTVAGVAGGLLQGLAGRLRRTSARVVLGAQDVGMAVAACIGAVAPGFGVFAGARVLGSVVSWPQHPVGSAYLAERFPDRRATVLSWHVAGGSAGTVVVPIVVSAVISVAGWRWALAVLAVVLLAGAALVSIALPADLRQVPADPTGDDTEAGSRSSLRSTLTERPTLALLAAASIAAGGRGLGTLSTYIPAYLHTGLHLRTLTLGIVFSAIMLASIVGPLFGGAVADRFGRRATLVTTYLAAAVALAGFGFTGHRLGVVVAVGACVGVLAYAESPLLQALFSEMTQNQHARGAFGAFFAIAYGVGSLWTAVIGWIIDTWGFAAAFVTMGGSFLVAGLIVARFTTEPASPGPSRPQQAPRS